jgi:hypothetical protein
LFTYTYCEHCPKITSFFVELPDDVLSNSSYFDGLNLPEEHVTLLPFSDRLRQWKERESGYLLFVSGRVTKMEAGGARGDCGIYFSNIAVRS